MSEQAHVADRKHAQVAQKPAAAVAEPRRGAPEAGIGAMQYAIEDPAHASPAALLGLQQNAGNRAVGRLIQAKLAVGAADDPCEREADRVAESVMASPAGPAPSGSDAGPQVQRQDGEEEIQTMPLARSISRLVRRESEEGDADIKRFIRRESQDGAGAPPADPRAGFEVGGALEQRLNSTRGAGSALPDATRSFMEARFGTDFGGVRLHTDGEAHELNRSLNAKAFTHGSDIYFTHGSYSPGSGEGQRLLAHELTHVVQQNGTVGRISRWGGPGGTTGHDVVTMDAFQRAGPALKYYRTPAREFIAHESESMDLRAGFFAGVGWAKFGWKKLSNFGAWTQGRGMGRRAEDYDKLQGYWRPESEMPNHGEAGMYKSFAGNPGPTLARIEEYYNKARNAWLANDYRQGLAMLSLGLHSLQDRGAHADGAAGRGHDPRILVAPPEGAQFAAAYNPDAKPGDCDKKAKNPSGYEMAVEQSMAYLERFQNWVKSSHMLTELLTFGDVGGNKRRFRNMRIFFGGGHTSSKYAESKKEKEQSEKFRHGIEQSAEENIEEREILESVGTLFQ